MRKILMGILLATSLMMVGCGSDLQMGVQEITEKEMIIKPSELSEETEEILELLDENLMFFDVKFNGSVKSYKLENWIYRDGEWELNGAGEFMSTSENKKIGIKIEEDKYYLYDISDDGQTTMEIDIDDVFEDASTFVESEVSEVEKIKLNEETLLWLKVGSSEDYISISDGLDFRDGEYESGAAVIITPSDKEVN